MESRSFDKIDAMQTYVEFSTKVWMGLWEKLFVEARDDEKSIPWFHSEDGAIVTGLSAVGGKEEGSPVTRALPRLASPDGKLATGIWDSTAGRHEIQFDFDEIVFFLEGEARVTALGETRTFRAGDVAFFRAGLRMSWEIPSYVRKVWVHRYPRKSLLRRAGAKLERLLGAL